MGDVVNLNAYRKRQARKAIKDDAAENRARHGRIRVAKRQAQKDQEIEAAYERALLEELVKHNKVDVPEGLVSKRLEDLLHEAKHGFTSQGASEEDFEKQKEQLSQSFQGEARRQVHLAFLQRAH